MYRCQSCDTPAQHGHDPQCLMQDAEPPQASNDPWWPEPEGGDGWINIASGEDVVV